METAPALLLLSVIVLSAVVGMLSGAVGARLAERALRGELRSLDADIGDLYERLETTQKRAAARARRTATDDDESPQGSLPVGVADPKLKERIRAAWIRRRSA